jgi:hypothetical protein
MATACEFRLDDGQLLRASCFRREVIHVRRRADIFVNADQLTLPAGRGEERRAIHALGQHRRHAAAACRHDQQIHHAVGRNVLRAEDKVGRGMGR